MLEWWQDFDEKRQEWRKQRKSVSDAIGTMTARALRFEDRERKTIALYALEFYKVGLSPFCTPPPTGGQTGRG